MSNYKEISEQFVSRYVEASKSNIFSLIELFDINANSFIDGRQLKNREELLKFYQSNRVDKIFYENLNGSIQLIDSKKILIVIRGIFKLNCNQRNFTQTLVIAEQAFGVYRIINNEFYTL